MSQIANAYLFVINMKTLHEIISLFQTYNAINWKRPFTVFEAMNQTGRNFQGFTNVVV